MTKPVVGAFVALFIALLGVPLWDAPGNSDLRRLGASELRDDLREAHASLLGARADLSEGRFRSASRRLEDARRLLRRAEARSWRLGRQDELKRLDLAGFDVEIDRAQRLLRRLDQGANSHIPWRPPPTTEVKMAGR